MRGVKKVKIVLCFLIVFTLIVSSVSAYPVIISESGIDHQTSKELVYSIPEKYYRYVDVIEFVNKPIKKFNQYYSGWHYVYWTKNHQCFNGRIWIYDNDLFPKEEMIVLELGNIYQRCILKQDIGNESFAKNFKI